MIPLHQRKFLSFTVELSALLGFLQEQGALAEGLKDAHCGQLPEDIRFVQATVERNFGLTFTLESDSLPERFAFPGYLRTYFINFPKRLVTRTADLRCPYCDTVFPVERNLHDLRVPDLLDQDDTFDLNCPRCEHQLKVTGVWTLGMRLCCDKPERT